MLLRKADVRFVVDATAESGFGHGARCLSLAAQIDAISPGREIVFQGRFSERARRRIAASSSVGHIAEPDVQIKSIVSVIDRMADPADINVWDPVLTERIAADSGRTIAIFSGDNPPDLPTSVIGLGYQPRSEQAAPAGWLWGLDFAPVGSDFLELPTYMPRRHEAGRLLIAMGAATDTQGIEEALEAALRADVVDKIEVLLSPLVEGQDHLRRKFTSDRITWLSNVADVRPHLLGANVVVTSYGNLGFEALALGRPVCFLAQKDFQARLAARLAQKGVAIDAGTAGSVGPDQIADAFSETFAKAGALSAMARQFIDGKGIDRIRDLILKESAND